MKILETEIDFDLLDADQMEKFEEEASKVLEKSKTTKIEKMTFSQALKEECEIIEIFFDNVFGEGTSARIFKGKKNLEEHIRAFGDIVDEKVKKQKDLENVMKKYMPNRKNK